MIIRISKDKNNPYVILNKHFLQDVRLSWKAKGLMAYLLSLPDDWKVYEEEVSKHSTDGIKALKSGVKELLACGYLDRSKCRNQQGQYVGWEYVLHEVSPRIPFSDVGFSDVRKSPPTNNDGTNNNQTNEKNDNGAFPSGNSTINQDVVEAMKTYMTEFYPKRKQKKHPYLKPEQYKNVYTSIAGFADEHCLEYDEIVECMLNVMNNFKLDTDYNINHFATEGIMLNALYNTGRT
jgi:hypothetical protein